MQSNTMQFNRISILVLIIHHLTTQEDFAAASLKAYFFPFDCVSSEVEVK